MAGLLLPCREAAPRAAGFGALRRRLVRTPAVERNLQAAALALCQQQPLLLQGPPGEALLSAHSPSQSHHSAHVLCAHS